MRDQPQEMQSIGILRIDLQDLPVEQFGLMKLACPVMLQCQIVNLRHGGHVPDPLCYSVSGSPAPEPFVRRHPPNRRASSGETVAWWDTRDYPRAA